LSYSAETTAQMVVIHKWRMFSASLVFFILPWIVSLLFGLRSVAVPVGLNIAVFIMCAANIVVPDGIYLSHVAEVSQKLLPWGEYIAWAGPTGDWMRLFELVMSLCLAHAMFEGVNHYLKRRTNEVLALLVGFSVFLIALLLNAFIDHGVLDFSYVAGWGSLGLIAAQFLQQQVIAPLLDEGTLEVETQARYKAGKPIETMHSLSRDNQGNPTGMAGYTKDMTEKQMAEAKLTESELKYRELYELSLNAILTINREGAYLDCNQAALDIFGCDDKEYILNASVGSLSPPVQPDGSNSTEVARAYVDQAFREGSASFEWVNLRENGEAFPSEVSLKRMQAGEQEVLQVVISDITEKKNAELEIIEAREMAEASNRAKSVFLANMSHEIRTPLNAIIGLAHLLRDSGLYLEQKEKLDKINASAEHLRVIIDDILDLSKIEAGEFRIEQTNFNIEDVFTSVHSLLKPQAAAKGLTMEVEIDDVPSWLRGDPTRLRQALLNYLSNAVKFTHQGTITLRALVEEDYGDEVLVRFEVQDTGIGIEQEKLAGLFQPFEQADDSTTRKYGGTGLGLTITKRLAQMMGGRVGADSEIGRGSTFWFTARLARGTDKVRPAASQQDPGKQYHDRYEGARILLVEDNMINCEVAMTLLNSKGMIVDVAENGKEAVDMVKSTVYDLVLMDLQMPVMDGIEATRVIRTMTAARDLPILAMTANVFVEDRQQCVEAGMNDFVAKPVEPKRLFETIGKWL
jgi:PAS domain S-box-containing protein